MTLVTLLYASEMKLVTLLYVSEMRLVTLRYASEMTLVTLLFVSEMRLVTLLFGNFVITLIYYNHAQCHCWWHFFIPRSLQLDSLT